MSGKLTPQGILNVFEEAGVSLTQMQKFVVSVIDTERTGLRIGILSNLGDHKGPITDTELVEIIRSLGVYAMASRGELK